MTRRDQPDPLQPEERALAEALARTAPPSAPSAELDAGILAAARAAAQGRGDGAAGSVTGAGSAPSPPSATAAQGRGRRRRSPAWLRGGALAATVVLAVGVAWQMRPQFEAAGLGEAGQVEVTAAPADAPGAPSEALRPRDADASPLRAEPAARPSPAEDAGPPPLAYDEPAAQARPATASEPASRSIPVVPAPYPALPAPPAPPAPAPATAPTPRALQARPPREPSIATGASARAREKDARVEALADTGADEAEAAHDGHDIWFDQPMDDIPPASVDSPAVREAWLARIRELVASDRHQEARDSFAEFRRRHPGAPVPDDLDVLLGGE